jgi:serine protease Do
MRETRIATVGIILVSSLLLSFVFTWMLYSARDQGALAADVSEQALAATSGMGSGGATATGIATIGFAEVAEKASRAVVYIEVEKRVDVPTRPFGRSRGGDPFDLFFGGPRRGGGGQPEPRKHLQQGLGSGFIVDADKGYVLTNNHVIEGADEITVTLAAGKGRKVKAKVVGSDPRTDVGVIQLLDIDEGTRAELGELSLANSDAIRVGEWVLAIGNPFGLKQTVTHGIISAKGRANMNIAEYEDFIQTDASINPGNSGGPLVNLAGEAIGMNTAIFSRSGGDQGISFAVPANMLRSVMDQLVADGAVERGQIGVMIQNVSDELRKHFDYKGDNGVLISEVRAGSPADTAGLRSGDIILSIDGKATTDVGQVKNRIGFTKLGASIEVTVWRDGDEEQVDVKVGKEQGASKQARKELQEHLGINVSNVAEKPNSRFKHGVVVEEIDPRGVAAFSGLRAGDVVLEVNRKRVDDADAFYDLLEENKGERSILFLIDRRGHRIFVLLRNR